MTDSSILDAFFETSKEAFLKYCHAHQGGRTWQEFAEDHGINYNTFRRRMSEARNALPEFDQPDLFTVDYGKPFSLKGDFLIVGDVHAPCTDYELAALATQIAKKHLEKPRQLLIVGDLVSNEWASTYKHVAPVPIWTKEKKAARHLMGKWLQVFDTIYWTTGNHERRAIKLKDRALNMIDLRDMILHSERIRVSNYPYCTIQTKGGVYRPSHTRNYSVNPLIVAKDLAAKYNCHIITYHQHRLAMGWDRAGLHMLIDGGGLFDPDKLAYVVLEDNKAPKMTKGFVLLKDGYPHLFGEGQWTDWSRWL